MSKMEDKIKKEFEEYSKIRTNVSDIEIINDDYRVYLLKLLESYGASKPVIDACSNSNFKLENILNLFKLECYGISADQLEVFANSSNPVSYYRMITIINRINEGQLTLDQARVCVKFNFTEPQLSMILKGFDAGLTVNQVDIYADNRRNEYSMLAIETCIENNMSTECIELLSDMTEFSDVMTTIKLIDGHVKPSVIKYYIKDCYMLCIIKKLINMGASINSIKAFMHLNVDEVATSSKTYCSCLSILEYFKLVNILGGIPSELLNDAIENTLEDILSGNVKIDVE